jgi:hypothetical protein
MGTRIKTRLRIAAHPFLIFFYNTIHLPHTTPRLALDADESVCCVRALCLTLSSFASLRVWAMLNLFYSSSLHTTQHLPCTLCAVRPPYPPDTSTTSSNHSRIKNLKLSRRQQTRLFPQTRAAPVMAKRCKTQLRLVIHTCASENLISEKHNGQAGPERPFAAIFKRCDGAV